MVSTVKFQPKHGNYIITSGYDGKCRIWSAKNWGLVKTLSGHEDKITCFDISPVEHVRVKMEVENNDDMQDILAAYHAPVQFVTSSFDRTWKLWGPDILSEI